MLDIGCGGGILSEPLARLGAAMVGADPSEDNIAAAQAHASETGVAVDYRATTAEDLSAANERFDVVLAMEVVEHVADVDAFVGACTAISPIASSLRTRPRGTSRLCASRSRQAATSISTASSFGLRTRVFSRIQASSGSSR